VHPELLRFLAELEAHFRGDERCLGMFLSGSIGRGTTDEYSDIDVAVVVVDEHYEAVRDELRPHCERLAGPIAAWLPEGDRPEFVNYAFLFEAGDEVLLSDVEVVSRRVFQESRMRPDRILFDRTGLLQAATGSVTSRPVTAQALARDVTNYWVYCYLSGKYFRRKDLYKLLYVQGVLFQTHLRVLNALESEEQWRWWAGDIQRLDAEKRQELLAYFPSPSLDAIAPALAREADLFSQDAQAACRKRGIPYDPGEEAAVRRHLEQMGVIG